MIFFNIIETSFFISLAITFILVFLLMYFFKKKVNTLESKYDAILTIVGNVVKEVNILRQAIMHTSVLHNMNSPSSIVVNTVSSNNVPERPLHTIEELDSESSDSDSDSEYEDDAEDEGEEESETDEMESTQNIHMVSVEKGEISDSDSDPDYLPNYSDSESDEDFIGEEEEIVFDNSPIELDVESEIAPPLELSEEMHEESVEISVPISVSETDAVLEPTQEETVPLYSGPSEILDITYEADDHEDVAEKPIEEQEDKESYKKMNIHQLKALVVTKGLVSDASKMKKNEIIRILEGTI